MYRIDNRSYFLIWQSYQKPSPIVIQQDKNIHLANLPYYLHTTTIYINHGEIINKQQYIL